MSGHEKLAKPMKEDVFLCLCAGQQPLPNPSSVTRRSAIRNALLSFSRYPGAASLQEFIVRTGDSKKKNDDEGLIGCAKVCNNVSVYVHLQQHAQLA
jgi:hypothetical protein